MQNLNLNINRASSHVIPTIPTLDTPIVISDTQINIPVTSSYPYEMWYSDDSGATYTKHGDGSATPYEATGLTAGTLYYFKARAVNGSKLSEFSPAANATTTLSAPTAFTSVFTVDTITGTLAWTDNVGGVATYEIYSNTNGAGDVLLTTTAAGATSYEDPTCKQNASVVYKIRAKKGSVYSDYATATALVTPLCWKTDQTVRTDVVINTLNIAAEKTVNIDWGDGTNANYTGNNANVTKTYNASAVNIFNIKLSGDTDSITYFSHNSQAESYWDVSSWVLPSSLLVFHVGLTSVSGDISSWALPSSLRRLYIYSTSVSGDISSWILPSSLLYFQIYSTSVSGDVSSWVLPSSLLHFYIYSTSISGALPNIPTISSLLDYRSQICNMSSTNIITFGVGLNIFNISEQKVSFPTSEIDKLLKAAADYYQVNAPTANCTYTMNGVNMGIPTGGASNVDLVRLAGYYTAQGLTATIVVRTS